MNYTNKTLWPQPRHITQLKLEYPVNEGVEYPLKSRLRRELRAWGIFESSLTTLNNSQCLSPFTGYLLAQHTLQLLVLNKFRLWRCTKSLISTSIQYILAADDDCSVLVKCSCRRRGSTTEEPQKKNNK